MNSSRVLAKRKLLMRNIHLLYYDYGNGGMRIHFRIHLLQSHYFPVEAAVAEAQ
jgi:hypothetical protein